MAFWRSEPKSPQRSVWIYGKVPWAGDFVRFASLDASGEALVDWIERSLEPAELRVGSAWPALFDTGAPHALVYRPPAGVGRDSVVVGVMAPSHDAVGRRFPIVAGSSLPGAALAGSVHLLPLVLGDFLERALLVIDSLRQSAHPVDIEAAARSIPLPSTEHMTASAHEYDVWAQSTPAESAWAAVFRHHALGCAGNALALALAAVEPWRGQERPSTRLALRLPLGIGGSAAACFWLDLLQRAAGWKRAIPTSFWTADEKAGSLLMHLGELPETSYAELWAPDPESYTVCDLSVISTRPPALNPRIAEILGRWQAPISDLLRSL